jgi:hypothetical protein
MALVLFGVVWPMTWRGSGGDRFQKIMVTASLRNDLGKIETAVAKHLKEAEALSRIIRSRRSLGTLTGAQAFDLDPARKKATGQAQPSTADLAADALMKVQAATAEAIKARMQQPEKEIWPDMALHGIVYAGKDSVAIINWEICRIGSLIEGMKVLDIKDKEVVLASKLGQKRVLALKDWETGDKEEKKE